jgi:hypothetical protein
VIAGTGTEAGTGAVIETGTGTGMGVVAEAETGTGSHHAGGSSVLLEVHSNLECVGQDGGACLAWACIL